MNADDARWWSDNQKQHLVANADDCDGEIFWAYVTIKCAVYCMNAINFGCWNFLGVR